MASALQMMPTVNSHMDHMATEQAVQVISGSWMNFWMKADRMMEKIMTLVWQMRTRVSQDNRKDTRIE